jgi:hypothetical protein
MFGNFVGIGMEIIAHHHKQIQQAPQLELTKLFGAGHSMNLLIVSESVNVERSCQILKEVVITLDFV